MRTKLNDFFVNLVGKLVLCYMHRTNLMFPSSLACTCPSEILFFLVGASPPQIFTLNSQNMIFNSSDFEGYQYTHKRQSHLFIFMFAFHNATYFSLKLDHFDFSCKLKCIKCMTLPKCIVTILKALQISS